QIFFATDGRVYRQSYILSVIGEALSKRTLNITIPESLASLVFYLGDKYAKLSGKQVLLNRDKGKEIMAESWLADAAKAAEILHWNPEDKLPQYIKETAECYRELGWL
ncbi:MAG: hypothetical protein PHO32_09885, partial [Candidatus Cloacimonetes bacterium]|nr:hypothetical protein [Candidatus Cloacimonadota bacterium]